MKIGIKIKLVAFIASLLLFIVGLFGVLIFNGIVGYQHGRNESILLSQKNVFEQYLSEQLNSSQYNYINKASGLHLQSGEIFDRPWLNSIPASIYNIKGNLIYSFEGNEKNVGIADDIKMIRYALNNKIAYIEINNNIYYYSPLKYNSHIMAVLRLKYSVKENNDFINNIKRLFIMLGLISLFAGIILGIIYLVPFTDDIGKMIYSVNNIQKGKFDDLRAVKRKDELGELSDGIVFMSSAIKNNIADLKKEKETLKKAVEKLEIMGKQQKQFIGNVTHEFKTPVTSIKAYGDLLQMYGDDPTLINEASENISKECERLTSMLDNVLKLSSLEKYDFETKKTMVKIKPLIEQLSSRMMGKMRKNKISLQLNLKDVSVLCDEEGLRYALVNLIDNAIKYNNIGGSVSINAYSLDNTNKTQYNYKNASHLVFIDVCDTGMGIPKESLQKIFEPFYRVKNDRSRQSGGTGLGLAFVKQMIEKQGGKILVQSTENAGSKFTIVMPFTLFHE